MPQRTITMITEQDSLAPVEGRTGALLESAPDAQWLPDDCVTISELFGSREDAKRRAAALVEDLLAGEPEIDGVRHLYVLKEILIRTSFLHQLALRLNAWLEENKIERCVFQSHSIIGDALRKLQCTSQPQYQVEVPAPPRRGHLHSVRQFVKEKGREGILDLPWLAAQRLFPIRARLLQRRSAGATHAGDWWFYSTFYTFTNIGLAYERSISRQFRYLTELRGTADRPLRDAKRAWDELYRFAQKGDAPGEKEVESARNRLREHLERAPTDDTRAKSLLLRSSELNEIVTRLLPLAILQTRVLQRWLDEAKPGLIVVGNEAWEGCLLQLARARGVPTVILQHGIFGDFYQYTEHSGDVIVARGEFWKEFLSERSQLRSAVLNCDTPRPVSQDRNDERSRGEDLLFVTSQYSAQLFWHPADLKDILAIAMKAANAANRRLVLRIHPRDSAEPYKQLFGRICSELGIAPEVEFSSGAGLDTVIQKSSVALLYYSTVFLDCLRLGVPIVSPGWHDFAFKDMVRQYGAFNFASNLEELETMLRDGLARKLPVSKSYEQFLAPTTPDEVRSFFEDRASARNK